MFLKINQKCYNNNYGFQIKNTTDLTIQSSEIHRYKNDLPLLKQFKSTIKMFIHIIT